MIGNNIKSLALQFVVTKKYDSSIYYVARNYRGGWRHNNKDPNRAYIFEDKIKAQEVCDRLNAYRKKILFKVEPAYKYFASGFEIIIDNYHDKVSINSMAIPLKYLNDKTKGVKTKAQKLEEHTKALNKLKSAFQDTKARIKGIENEYKEKFEKLEKDKQVTLEQNNKKMLDHHNDIEYLNNNSFEKIFEPYKTPTDEKMNILYGENK